MTPDLDALGVMMEGVDAVRYDFDGYGWQYMDSGSGSGWLTRKPDAEPLYAASDYAALAAEVRAQRETIAGLDARVEALTECLDKDVKSILKGKPLTEPPHVFPGKDENEYWRFRAELSSASAVRAMRISAEYRDTLRKTERAADRAAEQASQRERRLREKLEMMEAEVMTAWHKGRAAALSGGTPND
jgi:hypothetical protein